MAYIKCEPGKARGLNHQRVGVCNVSHVGDGGEANHSTKAHFAVAPVVWARKRTTITTGKDGIRRVPALRK